VGSHQPSQHWQGERLQQAQTVVARFPRPSSAVIPLLHEAQDRDGAIGVEAVESIAALTGERPLDVWEVVSFYTMFRTGEVPNHVLSVCTNIACWLRGGIELHEALSRAVAEGVLVEEVECLGACGGAPVVAVNGRYVENVALRGSEEVMAWLEGELK